MKKNCITLILFVLLAQALPVQQLVQRCFFSKAQTESAVTHEEEPGKEKKAEDGQEKKLLPVVYTIHCLPAASIVPQQCSTSAEAFFSYSFKDVITPPPDAAAC